MKIIVDTREQQPWAFPPEVAETARGTLLAGDYAIAGDDCFAIERKSLDDFVGTISSGWDRFEREMDRMETALFPVRVVIVEGSMSDIIEHKYNHPRVSPAFVLRQIAELTLRGVSVLLADHPVSAAGLAYIILKRRAEQIGVAE